MLEAENLDMVSVCVWPGLHAPMVVDAAKTGLNAIHCEKPMATTWGDARRMAAACDDSGVQLTLNHQRRFETYIARPRHCWREARSALWYAGVVHRQSL